MSPAVHAEALRSPRVARHGDRASGSLAGSTLRPAGIWCDLAPALARREQGLRSFSVSCRTCLLPRVQLIGPAPGAPH